MKSIFAILIIQFIGVQGYSQSLDSLYNEYVTAITVSDKERVQVTSEIDPIKCTTQHAFIIRENYDKLTPEQQNKVSFVLSRPQTETSFVTPSGFFRIHYNKTGPQAPAYDLDELAAALDSTYSFEINKLGYLKPPPDDGEGGDDLYDVYIQDMGFIYGETRFFAQPNSPSYMIIDNDFDVHFTKGIDGAQVTVAHEFHHAIQVGNYKYRSEDSYYYELLSTSMEEFVFDSVNDYYDYIPSYFNNPGAPFYATNGGGYDLAIWNIFLKEKYDFDIIKKGLENLSDYKALEAIALSIGNYGGSFKEDLNEFAVWNYFTGSRAKDDKYYKEAANYPKVKSMMTVDFNTTAKSFNVNSNPSSNNYFTFVDVDRGLPDTLVSIITNSNYQTDSRTEFEYSIYKFDADGSTKLNDLYYSKIIAANKSLFVESAIFNNELAAEGNTEREDIEFAYPQPFTYGKHSYLFIPTAADAYGRSTLNVYTSGMDLVFSSEKNIFANDKIVVRWDGKKSNGEKLPTGIYIYVTKAGDTVKKGKLVIYNE